MKVDAAGRLALVAVAAGLLVASGCTSTTRAESSPYFGKVAPPDGQTLRYISGSEPESLDPQVSTGQPEGRIYLFLFEGLTESHPYTLPLLPALADRRAGRG